MLLIGSAKEIVLRLSTSLEEQIETSMMLGVVEKKDQRAASGDNLRAGSCESAVSRLLPRRMRSLAPS